MPPKVYILGAGGHGRVVLEALRSRKAAAAFVDPAPALRGASVDGAAVVGGDETLDRLPKSAALANGVGAASDCAARRAAYERARAKGLRFPPVVAASALVSKSARLEDGAQVLTAAIVHPGASIGANAVVNTRGVVEHDAAVGAHAFVGPAAVLLGAARVGESAFVGAGAVVLPGVSVGARAVVGAGAVVTVDVPAGEVVAGVPARRLRR